jgi:hypothetical protein
MAIVKATYTRSRGGAKASISYIQRRPGKDREKITRTLFGRAGAMGRLEAESLIDEAQDGSFFYRFVLSPDPVGEDTRRDLNMQELTYKTMQSLEKRLQTQLLWVAALHAEHAPNRHCHIIAALPRKLSVKDFARLRFEATRASLAQRRALDFGQEHKPQQQYPQHQGVGRKRYYTMKYDRPYHQSRHVSRGGRQAHMHACVCPRCGAMHVEYGRFRVHQCTCGFIVHRRREPILHRKGREWGS